MTAQHARRANEQIRRLRAALQDARDTLCDHFGPLDDSVTACNKALHGEVTTRAQSPLFKAMAKNRLRLTVEQQRDMLELAARLDFVPITGNPFNQL